MPIETALNAAAVAAVNTDHHATESIRILRGPNLSAAQPPGI